MKTNPFKITTSEWLKLFTRIALALLPVVVAFKIVSGLAIAYILQAIFGG